jgi:glutamate carboxypeptidase
VGCPTLCGVGPVGGKAHTPEEYLEIDSIVPRAQAMALAILRLDRMD